MSDLTQKVCVSCEGGVPPLTKVAAEALLQQLDDWKLADDVKSIHKRLSFKNFAKALSFVNAVGEIAEREGHHPDISFGWGYVEILLTTHAVSGLSENDFIVASKIDLL